MGDESGSVGSSPEGGTAGGTNSEVAAFVDFENIRYSTINSFGREPDPIAWRDKALKYGLMAVARAYADFDQHPPAVRMRLDVAGFEAQHYPAKRTSDASGREKIQSRADLNFVVDVINTALTRPDVKTFLLFTGDKDFIRLVTTLRNRLGKRVVICGVPGSVSPDLVAAAGSEDPLQVAQSADVDKQVVRAIANYVGQLHDGFVPTQSHMSRTLWRFLDRTVLPSEHIEAKVMEFLRKGILTKRQTINGQGQELVTTEINISHPLVREAIPGYLNPSYDGLPREDDEEDGYGLNGYLANTETGMETEPNLETADDYDYDEEEEEEDDEEAEESTPVLAEEPPLPLDPEDNRGNLLRPGEARLRRAPTASRS